MSFLSEVFNKKWARSPEFDPCHSLFHNEEDGTVIPHPIHKGKGKKGFWTHINYLTYYKAFELLEELNKSFYIIIETGCNAHGANSTSLFDDFVNYYNGRVYSVDINCKAVKKAQSETSNKTCVTRSDSVKFLKKFVRKNTEDSVDLLYLDSFDLNWFKPDPSSKHHLKEYIAIKEKLRSGSIVFVDDTPVSCDWLDFDKQSERYIKLYKICEKKENKVNFPLPQGKGSFVYPLLKIDDHILVMHQYQMIWKIK